MLLISILCGLLMYILVSIVLDLLVGNRGEKGIFGGTMLLLLDIRRRRSHG